MEEAALAGQREKVEAWNSLATEALTLDWRITEYHDVEGPDGRTVELNGFASVMAGGERQRQARNRTKVVVEVLKAFPALLADHAALDLRQRQPSR